MKLYRLGTCVCLFLWFFSSTCFSLMTSSFEPLSLKGDRLTSNSSIKKDVNPFFKTLEPRFSTRGCVQTFSIKVFSQKYAWIRKSKKHESQKNSDNFEKITLLPGQRFCYPVNGKISSQFGYRLHPRERVMRMHSGIDIQAPRGTTVFPAAPGRVVYAKWKRGYGLMVELDHGNGFSTIYAHCSRLLVGEGKIVQTGTSIAQVGSTGVTTGSHLHFEVIHGSKLENPLKFLAK